MADMTPYEKWRRKQSGLEGTNVLLRDSPGFEIVPDIDVRSEDIVVDKTCNGAFTYTDFEHVLRAQGITHLMFSGCTTDVCVHATLREACDRNFQCLTISDACASGDQYAHEAALHMVTIEYGVWGALTDSAAVLRALAKLPNKAG
jgi:nicotinamidase-related amidase